VKNSLKSYAVTDMRNSETQHWRGKLRGYAVTHAPYTYMCAHGRVCVRVHACMRNPSVTA